ncbi:PPE family protein [Mycobacterium xenopi 3993]|nr:PPE family protein [Mycobacterium xenopi 3993]
MAALLESSDPSTVVANIAAWLSEAVSHELSMGLSMANVVATMEAWIGLGGAASALKGTELNLAGLAPMAAHCLKHVSIGQAAVEANTIARSSVIPSAVCVANRSECAADININPWVLGALSPRIAELEGEYTEYWGQNTGVGVTYATTLTTLMGAIASTPHRLRHWARPRPPQRLRRRQPARPPRATQEGCRHCRAGRQRPRDRRRRRWSRSRSFCSRCRVR